MMVGHTDANCGGKRSVVTESIFDEVSKLRESF